MFRELFRKRGKGMICRERLKMEHPEHADEEYAGGCAGCPHDYGYASRPEYCSILEYAEICEKCWEREVEGAEEKEVKKEFTKADLEDGMVVELRNGKHLLVIKRGKKIKMLTETQYYSGDDVTDDLREKNISEKRGELDIVKVFAPAPLEKVANVLNLIEMKGEMLWERREKMTLEEIEQELGYKIEIVEVDEKK